MKYIVGYPVRSDRSYMDALVRNKDSISELYFSWGDSPSGRSSMEADRELTAFEYQKCMESDISRIASEGIKLNLLFNANCYGRDAQSRAFFNKTGNLIDYVQKNSDFPR